MSEFGDLKPSDKCGIVAIASDEPVAKEIYYGLRILQHRGQESGGIATFDGGETRSKRGMGLVHEIFRAEDLDHLKGNTGIGHVRYSTTGSSVIDNAQPIVASTAYGDIALGHNGDIVNAGLLRDELAIRPLCIGYKDGAYMAASESVVFDTLGYKFVRDLKPGEIVALRPDGVESFRLPHPTHTAHCMFEWVYFARPDSVLDGRLVYDARVKVGQQLAREHPIEADIVVPVPESGRAQAQGYSQVSGLPVVEGLIKNRYIERTFIMPEQADREVGVLLKLNPIKSAVKNKRVVLIDDSIARGTTIKKIVKILREAGAAQVHLRIGCPPIKAPCYLGIDMKTRDQFIANNRTVEEVSTFVGADSLGYLSMTGLVRALSHPKEDICFGCLTSVYPVEVPGEKFRGMEKLERFAAPAKRAETGEGKVRARAA